MSVHRGAASSGAVLTPGGQGGDAERKEGVDCLLLRKYIAHHFLLALLRARDARALKKSVFFTLNFLHPLSFPPNFKSFYTP